jgi:hypothetical protein
MAPRFTVCCVNTWCRWRPAAPAQAVLVPDGGGLVPIPLPLDETGMHTVTTVQRVACTRAVPELLWP